MEERTEVLVIGGGPAGATAALLLARLGWSVALLEQKTFPRRKVCGEYVSATSLPLLDSIGIGEVFRDLAGPMVRRVGLFAGSSRLIAELPRPAACGDEWGRALAREHLDTILLQEAASQGVDVRQPWSVEHIEKQGGLDLCRARSAETGERKEIRAAIVIAAHGSWEPGTLPTQPERNPNRPSDLIGFKAHFRDAALPMGLMPLIAFRGGYGGMVHCDGGRISLSCCIRRDCLEGIPRKPGHGAGESVLEHILEWCPTVRPVLEGAERDGPWLSVGPIRPGIRTCYDDDRFRVGNAAGEAHPVVAEGISMAMQSAWLMAGCLGHRRDREPDPAELRAIGREYTTRWRRSFAARIRTSSVIAHWAMRPTAVNRTLPLLRRYPELLRFFARLSGKATEVIRSDERPD
jgi:2-polyprenyl-6-methoxyphenol hydroxylase-like FAD-dependent oxidoreductase